MDPHANCRPGDRAGTEQTCDRCGRTLIVSPADDFYCAAEGDHCCEACLVGGLPIFYVDASDALLERAAESEA